MKKQIATAVMVLKRVTKGAVLYEKNVDGEGSEAITSIYLRKSGLPQKPFPEHIEITIAELWAEG